MAEIPSHSYEDVDHVLNTVIPIVLEESNLVSIPSPHRVLVVGATRGHREDICSYMQRTQHLWDTAVFLGDYGDGSNGGLDLWVYLMRWKIQCHVTGCTPLNVYLLRGRRETFLPEQWAPHLKHPASSLLRDELLHTFGPIQGHNLHQRFCHELFPALPLAALVHEQYLCMCGGITPHMMSSKWSTLSGVFESFGNRSASETECTSSETKAASSTDDARECTARGSSHTAIEEMVWSEPMPEEIESLLPRIIFVQNIEKGIGYYYSLNAAVRFLERMKITVVVRCSSFVDVRYADEEDALCTLLGNHPETALNDDAPRPPLCNPLTLSGRPYSYQFSRYFPGYAFTQRHNPHTGIPCTLELFSAPHFLDINANKAALVLIAPVQCGNENPDPLQSSADSKKSTFRIFSFEPSLWTQQRRVRGQGTLPYNIGSNAIKWSLPFLVEHTASFVARILRYTDECVQKVVTKSMPLGGSPLCKTHSHEDPDEARLFLIDVLVDITVRKPASILRILPHILGDSNKQTNDKKDRL